MMKKDTRYLLLCKFTRFGLFAAIFCLFCAGCTNEPDFSDIPEISFGGFNKDSLTQGTNNADSIKLFIDFKDGDGDIGVEGLSSSSNLFIIDLRTGKNYGSFKVPAIPATGANKGVEGRITLNLFSTCCIFPNNIVPCSKPKEFPSNDLSLEIYLLDRANNKSNVIKTSNVRLLCK